MKSDKVPDTVKTIIAQAGGMGLRGAFAYIGARGIRYKCAESFGECRSGRPSRLGTFRGRPAVDYEVGLQCRVNGKRGRAWRLIIAYEHNDTYTVWLVEGHCGRQAGSMVLARHEDVYCDALQSVIEAAYDEAIREHNGGFIPIS